MVVPLFPQIIPNSGGNSLASGVNEIPCRKEKETQRRKLSIKM